MATMRILRLSLPALLTAVVLCGGAQAGLVQADFNDLNLGVLQTQAGGVGMTGTWGNTGTIDVIGGDLSSPLYTLTQSGTPQSVQGDYGQPRQSTRAVATPMSGDVWFSYLVNIPNDVGRGGISVNQNNYTYGNPRLGAADTRLFLELPDGMHWIEGQFTAGATALVVGQMQIGAGNDTIQVWVNPDLVAQPDITAYEPAYYNASTNFASSVSRIGVASYRYGGPSGSKGGTVDNVVFSDTPTAYQDVTGSTATLPTVVLIDDGPSGSPNTSSIIWSPSSGAPSWNYRPESGTWEKPNSFAGTGSRFASAADPAETATYVPDLPQDGGYRVEMWWPTFNWAPDVPVTISHLGGTHTLTVDQSTNSGQWNTIGTFAFDAGTAGTLTISSEGVTPGTSGAGPVADAVRFVYIGDLGPTDIPLPVTAYASSTHPQNPNRPPANVVNGAGMTDEDGDGIPESHAANTWGDNINWMADSFSNDPAPWFMLDLGGPYPVASMKVWNFNVTGGRTDRGVGVADIYVSLVDDIDTTDPDFTDADIWTLLMEGVELREAPGTNGYDLPDEIDFGSTTARWIALDIQENLGGTFVGLSEIQVFLSPEPTSLALLALGGVALLRRRRTVK